MPSTARIAPTRVWFLLRPLSQPDGRRGAAGRRRMDRVDPAGQRRPADHRPALAVLRLPDDGRHRHRLAVCLAAPPPFRARRPGPAVGAAAPGIAHRPVRLVVRLAADQSVPRSGVGSRHRPRLRRHRGSHSPCRRQPLETGPVTLRDLPSIDVLLQREAGAALRAEFGRTLAVDALRLEVDRARAAVRQGVHPPAAPDLVAGARRWLRVQLASSLQPVINATGVILHTNLGRAVLSQDAQQAMLAAAAGYSTLEYDLSRGERGRRAEHLEPPL